MEFQDLSKRQRSLDNILSQGKKPRICSNLGFCYLRPLEAPMKFSSSHSVSKLICLRSDRIYTFGRKDKNCDVVIDDHRVSKRHCQVFLNGFERGIFVLDGFISSSNCDFDQIRVNFRSGDDCIGNEKSVCVKASLNGVFVNGVRVERDVKELFVGDEVLFVCGCESGLKIGFVVENIVFSKEFVWRNEIEVEKRLANEINLSQRGVSDANQVFALETSRISRVSGLCESENKELTGRALFLLSRCRYILQSVDPITSIRKCLNVGDKEKGIAMLKSEVSFIGEKDPFEDITHHISNRILSSGNQVTENAKAIYEGTELGQYSLETGQNSGNVNRVMVKTGPVIHHTENLMASKHCLERNLPNANGMLELTTPGESHSACFQQQSYIGNSGCKPFSNGKLDKHMMNSVERMHPTDYGLYSDKDLGSIYSSQGKKFFLNHLECMPYGSCGQHTTTSLPELFHPINSLLSVFIATFTSDISWFLSCCEVPNLLPITIACHNTERCWSSSPDKRTSIPYPDYPNLIVVYPPFPDVIAFGKDRKKQGVACHHPKLLVLQRYDCIRIIVTSANLVSKQWNSVTNTVWWQDFPRHTLPDYVSLFTHSHGEVNEDSKKSDFAAQLAGFIASLLVDVPSQAHWVLMLTEYDFGGSAVHLVASIPGIHMQKFPYLSDLMYFLSVKQTLCSRFGGMKFLGSVQASVVGLSHRFHSKADSNGAQLKTLAAFLGKCRENAYGMSEVILKRNNNIPADSNAVSVLICDLDECFEGDCIQLGFLPKSVAKWVAPLCDIGFFSFSACIYPKEALAVALEGTNSKVQLILYVSQGPNFSEMSRQIKPVHVTAIFSLLSCLQRSVGLWRLQEVLSRYKWPESQETDFVYGSSSIGTSVNAQFLAAFSAAAGKSSFQFSESEESDPEWGRWNASHELKSPSMRIVFPTIERVKSSLCGIWPSRRLLSLSEKTWQRLSSLNIFHDAIPHPSDRVGYPMHVKVARRRFVSKIGTSSFGWVYCGSHNFSRAAWGHPITQSLDASMAGVVGASNLSTRLHICNYELGILFIIPPPETSEDSCKMSLNLDDIILPFVVPSPKYGPYDVPATAQSMRAALAEAAEQEREKPVVIAAPEELMDDEVTDEEDMVEATDYVVEEKEDEQAYAETLWSQVDSSQS